MSLIIETQAFLKALNLNNIDLDQRSQSINGINANIVSFPYFFRRLFSLAILAFVLTSTACSSRIDTVNGAKIDARVDVTLVELYREYPDTRELASKATGILVMPLITEAGIGFGGAFGRGALRVNEETADYYSFVQGSGGLQLGAQQYAHVLFFMTDEALNSFRKSDGWVVNADLEYALFIEGETISNDTTAALSSVVAVIFGQTGIRVGATFSGAKYTRLELL
ncbi:MAG: YSC84-related protein [Aestuariivita sp.]|nr:YSC84-related protein [Aestuariivita sp.]